MAESVGRIDLDLGINPNSFNKQLSGISSMANGMVGGVFKKLGASIAGAFAVNSIYEFSKSAVGLASDLAEVQNVVDVTFGSMSQQVNDFSKNALKSFGLSELSAKKFTSTIGAMLKSSGIAGQSMTDVSMGVTQLAADFASFYNLDQQDAFDKIRSGLMGETEPLKAIGKNLSVASLEAYALSKGITKQYQNMTQAEQVLLRYNYLLSVSKDQMGDFARTSGSWANQTRVLTEQWNTFKGTLGSAFIAILTPMLRNLNALILKLQVAANYFKAFTDLVFGVSPASTAAASVDKLAVSTGDVADSAKKASKAIKNSLAGFDQLNLLSKNTSKNMDNLALSTSGISNSVQSGKGKKSEPLDLIPKGAMDQLKAFKQEMSPYFEDLSKSLSNLRAEATEFANSYGVKVILEFAGKLLKSGFKGAVTRFTGAVDILVGSIKILNGIATLDFERTLSGALTIFQGIYEGFKGKVIAIAEPFIPDITKRFDAFESSIKTAWDKLKGNVINYGTKGKLELSDFVKYAVDKGNAIINGAFTSIKTAWKNLLLKAKDTKLGIAVLDLAGYIGITGARIKTILDKGLETIKTKWSDFKTTLFSKITSFDLGKLIAFGTDALLKNVKEGINTVITTLNTFLRTLNKIKINIPEVNIPGIGSIGGGSLGFPTIPEIPKLANGGLAYQPQLAMVGDNRGARQDPEVIAPLSKLEGLLEKALTNKQPSGDATVVLKIGETEFGRVAIRAINSVHRQTGQTLLLL